MSSTVRSKKNSEDFHERDVRFTPHWVTEAILPHVPVWSNVLDPCCGNGSILQVCKDQGFGTDDMTGIDIDSNLCRDTTYQVGCGTICANILDVNLSLDYNGKFAGALIITNPPFSIADELIMGRLVPFIEDEGGILVCLLRLAWVASQKRAEFHRRTRADIYVLPRRPSFTGDGKTDSADYAWFVWGPGRGGRWQVL